MTEEVSIDDSERIYPPKDTDPKFIAIDEDGKVSIKVPINLRTTRPSKEDGTKWDQTHDAAAHMRYAATLNLPTLGPTPIPKRGTAIIVGGSPSVKDYLEQIKELKKDKKNYLFAINWTHTWLINHGIIPDGTVFFEIDVEAESVLKSAHPDVTYYICSHCDPRTFDQLKNFKRILWHSMPNSKPEEIVREELFKDTPTVGGGIYTLTRTITVGMFLGYRDFELFGCDSSFPEESGTHVEGYETTYDAEKEGLYVYAKYSNSDQVAKFRTVPPLALQQKEFEEYCKINHAYFTMRVHGDGLIPWTHKQIYPTMYED